MSAPSATAQQPLAEGMAVIPLPSLESLPSRCILDIYQDTRGEMWYGTEDGLCRDNGHSVRTYYPLPPADATFSNNKVQAVSEDACGLIWCATPHGAFTVNPRDGRVERPGHPVLDTADVSVLLHGADGSLWAGTRGHLYRLHPATGKWSSIQLTWHNEPALPTSLCEDAKGRLWVTLNPGGVCRIAADGEQLCYYPWPYRHYATAIIPDRSGTHYWVGAWLEGIARFDPFATSDGDMWRMADPEQHGDERDGVILSLAQDDQQGRLWATTMKGLKVFAPRPDGMLDPVPGPLPEDGRYQMLTRLAKDRDGNIWVGGFNVPSYIVTFSQGRLTRPLMAIGQSSGHRASISQVCADTDPNIVWAFQERHRLYLYNLATGRIASDVESPAASSTHNNLGAVDLLRPSAAHGGVWAACSNPRAIYLLRHSGAQITEADRIELPGAQRATAIAEDGAGVLWIGTPEGLYTYSHASRRLSPVADCRERVTDVGRSPGGGILAALARPGSTLVCTFSPGGSTTRTELPVECTAVAATADTTLWAGTRNGHLLRLRPGSKLTALSDISDFVPSGYISQLFTDSAGALWAITEQRVSRIDIPSLAVTDYYLSDPGVELFNIFPHSYALLPGGNVVFGGTGGLLEVMGGATRQPGPEMYVHITGVRIEGQPVPLPPDGEALPVPHDAHDIEIEFSANRPLLARHTTYEYRLGGDERWSKLSPGDNRVVLNRLSSGHHTFEVRVVNSHASTAPAPVTALVIDRQRAFWETWWFALLMVLALAGVAALLSRVWTRRRRLDDRRRMEEELVQAKFRFFTNITHELRTPLTLIVTPLESLLRKVEDGPIRTQLLAIRKSAAELTSLINDILNFRRLEMGGEKLSLSRADAAGFLGTLAAEFAPLAAERGIDFSVETLCRSCYMEMDINKLRIIVNNLLSNAFKFSRQGDRVVLRLEVEDAPADSDAPGQAVITVSDTGTGISADELPHIFERFFQAGGRQQPHAGSGIGLHLVSEYIKLMGGTVDVSSELGRGTDFTVRLPLLQPRTGCLEAAADESSVAVDDTDATGTEDDVQGQEGDTGDHRRTLLVIEDNDEFRRFLRAELSDTHRVVTAPDAIEGERLAREVHPDVIISDIMMPGRDGYELCRRLKADLDTSDIPVILLTALANNEAHIKAMECHADAFVTKPFNLEILLRRIDWLMALRRRKQEYIKSPVADMAKLDMAPLDQELMEKIMAKVEANLSNSEYSVTELSADVNMSRMNLYRKLQNLTGQTPSDFIKNVRLKRAARMLLQERCTIVEVAYAVGFSSHSYFSRSFKAEFGVTPRQFLEQNIKGHACGDTNG